MDQSEEIECQVIVQKFLEEDNYIIEFYDHYLSVESISNDAQSSIQKKFQANNAAKFNFHIATTYGLKQDY